VTNPSLPEWYFAEPENKRQPRFSAGLGRSAGRGVYRFAEALALELSSGGRGKSWVGAIDPRAGIVGVLILIVGATFLDGLFSPAMLLLLALVMIAAGGISVRRSLKVLLPAWFFSLVIILPSVLNIITPGEPVFWLWHFAPGAKFGPWSLPAGIFVTGSGIFAALRFLLRTGACVAWSFFLIAVSGPSALVSGLRRLGLPRMFGMTLTMAERYLASLLRAAFEIHLAKLSRSISPLPLRREQSWAAAGIGDLFRRSYYLANEVYHAMLARGYDGDLQTGWSSRMRVVDFLWMGACAGMTGLLLWLDRLF
jgi:cobalt/nickel transport system permease protein